MEVKVRLKSTVTMLAPLTDGGVEEDEPMVLSYTVRGNYAEDGGKVAISYTEPEEYGFENTVTTLVFDIADRGVVTLVRTGEASAAFRFDMNERRQKCVYETPFMPCELTFITKKVANTVKNGSGAMLLDYLIEINGSATEHNRTLIEVKAV